MSLRLALGGCSEAGRKPRNEDVWQLVEPQPPLPASKGVLVLLADGVSECADGQLAAHTSARTVAGDYYATPDTWTVTQSLDKLFAAQNAWLLAQPVQPLLTTMAALVLRGSRFTVASVGDTRVYRLRQGAFEQLSVDHGWSQPGWQHVLKRALGLDAHLVPDFAEGPLQAGDRFLLVTDGVWGVVADARLRDLLQSFPDPQAASDALVRTALAEGSEDNASAVVADVLALPERSLDDELAELDTLPLPPRLKRGQKLDGLLIERLWHENRGSLLYQVRDENGEPWLLKTLQPKLADDEQAKQGLMTEEWLLRRLASHYFPELHSREPRRFLYLLQRQYEGETLAERKESNAGLSVPQAVQIGIRLGRALAVLHRRNVLHRDIKPENLHLDSDGRLRILDFGAACCPGLNLSAGPEGSTGKSTQPGTPSFMAPELLEGNEATVRTDLYAAGVTLYWLLTGHYPYGEVEPFQRPRFGDPVPPTRYRPDLPDWLAATLLKGVARLPQDRFETAEELVFTLERGENQTVQRRTIGFVEREPLKFWQYLALGGLLLNLVQLYMTLLRK